MKTTTEAARMLRLIQALADEFDREAPLTYVLAFLRTASAGDAGLDQGRLADDLRLSSAGASRAVQALSGVHWLKDREGLQLVERIFDPVDNRRRSLRVTLKGTRLIERAVSRSTGG